MSVSRKTINVILDNRKNGKVSDELRKQLNKGAKLSIISSLFSIYAFEALKEELGKNCEKVKQDASGLYLVVRF